MNRSPEQRREEIKEMGFPEPLSRLALPVPLLVPPFILQSKRPPMLAGRLSSMARLEYRKRMGR